MSDRTNEMTPVRGWTIKQIANYVAGHTGGDTPISLVWNWHKRTESLEKGDPHRFPEDIGIDDKGQKVFNPLEVVQWLKFNKKIGNSIGIHPHLWGLLEGIHGTAFNDQFVESLLRAFLDDSDSGSGSQKKRSPDFVTYRAGEQLRIGLKKFKQGVSQLDVKERRDLLEQLQRFLLADKFSAEFHTPPRLASLAARLLGAQPKTTVYDPCAGTGRLLAAVADESKEPTTLRLIGQELNELTSRLGHARISVSGAARDSGIRCGDSLKFDARYVGFADYVIAHIPVRTKVGHEELLGNAPDPRFVYTKPTMSGDVAWIQVLLGALAPRGGRAVVIGSLFSTSHRQSDKLREALLRRRHVEAVITLAKNRREYGHGLPPTLIVFDTDLERSFRRKQILFAEVTDTADEQQANSADAFLVALVKALRSGNLDATAQPPGITWRTAPHQEVVANKFLLSPSRYTGQPTRADKTEDLEERIRSASRKLADTRQQLQDFQSRRRNSK
jgi:hypothetical protein